MVTFPSQERFLRELPAVSLARDSGHSSDDSDICVVALKKAKSVWLVTAFGAEKENPIAGGMSESVVTWSIQGLTMLHFGNVALPAYVTLH